MRTNPLHVALAGGAMALVAAAVVAITAHATGLSLNALAAPTPSPSPNRVSEQANCQDLVAHFASDLGKSTAQVNGAFQQALGETLADEVKSGRITQAQADQIKAKAGGQQICAGFGGLPWGLPAPGGLGAVGPGGMNVEGAVADALHITTAQLQQDARNGMTTAQIAAQQGVTQQSFVATVVADLTKDLDQALSSGKITQQQHDAAAARLSQTAMALWDAKRAGFPGARPGFGGRPGGPRPSPAPSSTTG